MKNTTVIGTHPLCRDNASPYLLVWITTGAIALSDFIWLRESGIRLVIGIGLQTVVSITAITLVILWTHYRARGDRHPPSRWGARLQNLAFTGKWMLTLAAFCTATSILSSLSITVAAPLIDDQLIRIDRIEGFDWLRSYRWSLGHPLLSRVFHAAYASGLAQMIAVPVILGIAGRRTEMVHHITRLMLAILLCLTIATVFPAASAFLHFHIADPGTSDTVSTFFPLRDGSLRIIDLTASQGLVSMPSLHATMAVLFTYALRRVAYLAHAATALNALMLASTITQGGHYLCDVLAGVALAGLTIVLVKRVRPRVPLRLRHAAGAA
ncbi:MAG: phosphatase PAP2 family protein [Burkholderia sp.]